LDQNTLGAENTVFVIIDYQQSNTVNFTIYGVQHPLSFLNFLCITKSTCILGPQINSIEPVEGATSGNYPITIRGHNFGTGTPQPVVNFASVEVEVCKYIWSLLFEDFLCFPQINWISSEEVVIINVPKGIGKNKTIEITLNYQSDRNDEFGFEGMYNTKWNLFFIHLFTVVNSASS
jgi:IPT/TIG domain